ncbi:catalase family protein [Actinomycetospora sp. OC33-EN08]|uniref:Catalase family protein n=1 Tax=Actinomycetospora aurantiaca TaxID=3129233 RepID=A0ABU8MWX8_9PSEU
MTTTSRPLPWTDDVEAKQPHEDEHVRRCIDSMLRVNAMTFDRHRHGYRATHAKSHGFLRGTLTVHEDLPPELAQGLFATGGARHDVVVRLATESGQLDDDRKPNARGLSLKVFDVEGETMEPGTTTQDLLFNTLPVLGPGTAQKFMELSEIRERHFSDESAMTAEIQARPDAEQLTSFHRLVGNIHPLAHAYYTQGALGYGEHVAKIAVRPGTPEQEALAGREVTDGDDGSVLRALVESWATDRETVFDVGVQLRTSEDMPVEDASVDWSQEESPYRSVATIRLPPQQPYSAARRVFGDDRLAFRPWHGLAAHRPLGSVNRLRRAGYEELGKQRTDLNAVEGTTMRSASELPD